MEFLDWLGKFWQPLSVLGSLFWGFIWMNSKFNESKINLLNTEVRLERKIDGVSNRLLQVQSDLEKIIDSILERNNIIK